MTEPIISFKDFSFQYHSQAEPTLHHVNIDIFPGEKVLVIGASGSGKSTFLNCINGLIPFKIKGDIKGELYINGLNAVDGNLHERSNIVGTVLQDTDGQFIGLTAAEDMAFLLENNLQSQDQMQEEVAFWADKVGIQHHLNHRPQDLSGGQKQRVSLGGILIHRAPILILDEPLANLDPRTGVETMSLLQQIHQDTQTTMLIVEHRLEEALDDTFDRVLLFKEGHLIADTTPSQLLKSTQLIEAGIREPLYSRVLKYADAPLQEIPNLANLKATAHHSAVQTAIQQWFKPANYRSYSNDNNTPLLSLEHVNFQYGTYSSKVLDDINLTINAGEMISIVGHNGAGKSTLAKAICGFVPATGNMKLNNKDFSHWSISERSNEVGYVMQNPNHMISEKMIYDEVALGLRLRHIAEEDIKQRVMEVLAICGLYTYRNWPIAALSYGQKKRVTIASILVLDPQIIILDEPTAGQDYRHYTEMMLFLEQLNQQGKIIIMITHDMHLLVEYTQRTLVIAEGRLIADTTPIAVLDSTELCELANLRQTSLYALAQQLNINNVQQFVSYFIEYDREVKRYE
ncbi:ABC transporter ATP-binding protein [Staphylococcus simiae]|uniref:ABC transporter ATP-binding protein n=1 Tax=Staphylococcus simiae TaxID=308354 RepID=UPI001A96B74F|nr:ABC transporter ATP-binding protein [Staphylococcus simiae]MBO1199045.1 ABC transporter ATP-binding protein [Staphylococcus simiae]MBO1201313.1 ABC transporter ATP-binding protein [Staphylococcus simiae]MBO1203443.1 ABC transporter ATP-binding protein [Staphylococcus simiae]MBO1210971.1 ABC transporter ATP-binding protein [Staphylococcus simiae]MBO1229651.1 ABC transporter ATP-binding protein [Staphylococcus simiae]